MSNELKGGIVFAATVSFVITVFAVIAIHWNTVQSEAAIACAEAGKNWYNSNCVDKPLPE
jgi:hypothetical protein